MAESSNVTILSYHDTLIRKSDFEILKGPNWLNDTIISFYFEFINKKIEKLPPLDLLLVGPELTQLLKLSDVSNYNIFLDPLNAKGKNFILFPVNDCERKDSAGGSHWSLLVFSRPEKTCYHFDSLNGYNAANSRDFSDRLMKYMFGHNEEFSEVNCPQQNNGYDCGLFVLCFVDEILEHICENSKVEGCDLSNMEYLVSIKREELLNLIGSLAKSQEKNT